MIDGTKAILLAIDVQNDFCPAYTTVSGVPRRAGALAVPKGDEVMEPLNRLGARVVRAGGRLIATQDWHPSGHISFAAAHPEKVPGDTVWSPGGGEQVLWPDHAVQGSPGAAFHDRFEADRASLILRKGFRADLDSYSAFFENDRKTSTGLDGLLRGLGVTTVIAGGLATDYCVLYSVLDAVRLGYTTMVLIDAVRGVDYPEGSVEQAFRAMGEAGVILTDSFEVEGSL
ncbi:MAG: bifunctional nicotinamidase/pyrazinamidase [Spirochaetaceae bacterium]|jgi:nicotinamidase/pyrazinamidase|nr:bifunctional nicotinamidase/pyrazinamidase [Spirochaetaceae bacterium]